MYFFCFITNRHANDIHTIFRQAVRALSGREQEVPEYITKGFTYAEIAGLISVSQHTVLTCARSIYAKLEVNSQTEAIYEARNLGLLAE
jgi:ATP/maltotriose-dependent transcriptional regulator MalT